MDQYEQAVRPATETSMTPITGHMLKFAPPTKISRVSIRAQNWNAVNTAPRNATSMDFFKRPLRLPAKAEIFRSTLNISYSSSPSRTPR